LGERGVPLPRVFGSVDSKGTKVPHKSSIINTSGNLEVLILKGLRFLVSPPESTLLENLEVLILKGLRCLINPP
jgi:hypothetical protein